MDTPQVTSYFPTRAPIVLYQRCPDDLPRSCSMPLRIFPSDEERLRPIPKPPPNPTARAATPTRITAQRGVPPALSVFVVVGVVPAPVDALGEAAGVAPDFTVNVNAPSSGSPSSAEIVSQRTMYTPSLCFGSGLMGTDISFGLVSETVHCPG